MARYLLGFVVALFVKTGTPDLTLLRFVTRVVDMAHKQIQEKK